MRYIDFSPIGTTILPIYSQFNVLPLPKLIDLERANYMYSFSNDLLPSVFRSYVSKPTHRYETRFSRSNYVVAPYLSKIGESSIKVIGPNCWTNISSELKKLPFRKTFSKHLKKLYLSELPTKKRTKNLNLSKTKELEVIPDIQVILNTSIFDNTFLGFDI